MVSFLGLCLQFFGPSTALRNVSLSLCEMAQLQTTVSSIKLPSNSQLYVKCRQGDKEPKVEAAILISLVKIINNNLKSQNHTTASQVTSCITVVQFNNLLTLYEMFCTNRLRRSQNSLYMFHVQCRTSVIVATSCFSGQCP